MKHLYWALGWGFVSGVALAAEKSAVESYRWVDEKGNLITLPAEFHTEWVWKVTLNEKNPDAPSETPFLRLWIDSPQGHKLALKPHSGAGDQPRNPGSPPFKSKGEAIALDAPGGASALTFPLYVQEPGSTKRREFSLIVVPQSKEPSLLVHPSCENLGLRLSRETIERSFNYAAISCRETSTGIQVYWQHSDDIETRASTLPAPVAKGSGWALYALPVDKLGAKDSSENIIGFMMGSMATPSKAKERVDLIHVASEQRFTWNGGLGMSYVSYDEPAQSLSTTSFNLTGKAGARYAIVPGRWSLDGSAYLTLLPLTTSPSGVAAARYFGLNARAGYQIPKTGRKTQWNVYLGWYFWGMLVKDKAYGVASLYGPQLFVTTKVMDGKLKDASAYVKYAPIFNESKLSTFTFGNFELAAGLAYPLTRIKHRFPLNGVLDVAWTRGKLEDQINEVRIFSVSLGTQIVF